MRIYEGQIYSLSSAVEPECRGFHCEFLHISSPRIAFVHYGNGRFLQVGANSRMRLSTRDAHGKWHYKLVKIPFVKVGDRLEFDYPAYLKASGIAFRVYPDADIYGSDDSNYHMIYSKATPHKGQYVGCAADFSSDCLMTTTRYCMYR